MSNHQAIKNFVDYWRGKNNFETAPTGNCTFRAAVKYMFDAKVIEQDTTATIIRNGYEDGKVSISERGTLSAELFHLDFSPDFQKFKYKKSDHSFTVEGDSPKMHGPYKVIISPQ
jgi:hypothetical protein